MVLADNAHSSRAIRTHLRRRGVHAVIPQPSDRAANRKRRGRHGGRPPAFDRDAYKPRNTVERCINRLRQWRGPATRYDNTATIYLAGLHIAAIFLWPARRSEGNGLGDAVATARVSGRRPGLPGYAQHKLRSGGPERTGTVEDEDPVRVVFELKRSETSGYSAAARRTRRNGE